VLNDRVLKEFIQNSQISHKSARMVLSKVVKCGEKVGNIIEQGFSW
jgi:hypothetical protein